MGNLPYRFLKRCFPNAQGLIVKCELASIKNDRVEQIMNTQEQNLLDKLCQKKQLKHL
jgi:hypothetical protein